MRAESSCMGLAPLCRKLSHPFCYVATQQEDSCLGTGSGSSADTESATAFILDFSASSTVRKKFLLFISLPVCGISYDSSPKRLKYIYYSKSISCHCQHDFRLCPSEKGPHEESPIKTSEQSSASGEPGLPGPGS